MNAPGTQAIGRVGFIGLGGMDLGMAHNVLRGGYELSVYGRRADVVQELVDAGASTTGSVAELAGECQVLLTCLPGPRQLEDVALGDGGIAESMGEGLTLIDFSTSSVALARRIDEAAAAIEADLRQYVGDRAFYTVAQLPERE